MPTDDDLDSYSDEALTKEEIKYFRRMKVADEHMGWLWKRVRVFVGYMVIAPPVLWATYQLARAFFGEKP